MLSLLIESRQCSKLWISKNLKPKVLVVEAFTAKKDTDPWLQVKSKVWIAHSSGRKHHENIEQLKRRLQHEDAKKQQMVVSHTTSTSVKRLAAEESQTSAPAIKKRKGFILLDAQLF